MPQRNRTQTITGGPQGEDAQLVVMMPTYGESREYAKKLTRLERQISALMKQVEDAKPHAATADEDSVTKAGDNSSLDDIDRLTDQLTGATATYLSDHLIEWNWVGDDDAALTKPHRNPEIMDSLTNDEIRFIQDALNGATAQQEDAKKKLRTKS